jgi:hypothetical protein
MWLCVFLFNHLASNNIFFCKHKMITHHLFHMCSSLSKIFHWLIERDLNNWGHQQHLSFFKDIIEIFMIVRCHYTPTMNPFIIRKCLFLIMWVRIFISINIIKSLCRISPFLVKFRILRWNLRGWFCLMASVANRASFLSFICHWKF